MVDNHPLTYTFLL